MADAALATGFVWDGLELVVAARFLTGVLSLIVSKIVRRGFLRDWD